MEHDMQEIQGAIARADLYELLRHAFAFPTKEFIQALEDARFEQDLLACVREAAFSDSSISLLKTSFETLKIQSSSKDIFADMKKEYSRMFLAPGDLRLIYPYESAFVYVEKNPGKMPSLFFTAIALDVEQQMRDAGVIPRDARTEPVDSIFNEFEFMVFLCTQLAIGLQAGDKEQSLLWRSKIQKFGEDHVISWIPRFLEKVSKETRVEQYRALASIANIIVQDLNDMDIR